MHGENDTRRAASSRLDDGIAQCFRISRVNDDIRDTTGTEAEQAGAKAGGASARTGLKPGFTERLREEFQEPSLNSWRDAQIAAGHRALQDDAAFDRAWEEGRSWTLDEAVRCAMEI